MNENPKRKEERMEALDWLYCLASAIVIVANPTVIIASGESKPCVSPTATASAVTSDVCALGMPPAAASCLASTFRVRK